VADKDADRPGLAALKAPVDGIDGGPPVAQFFPRDPRRFAGGGPVHAGAGWPALPGLHFVVVA
jgi:hypothetical protein